MCPGGEIGRRNGLKIRFPATGVRVQFPPRAPIFLTYTWDAAVRYWREKMEYSVNLTNFLDKTHYFISAIDDTQIYPGPPIDIAGTVRYHF
jgi:hypothetical protein